jgi:hypothetical protein
MVHKNRRLPLLANIDYIPKNLAETNELFHLVQWNSTFLDIGGTTEKALQLKMQL